MIVTKTPLRLSLFGGSSDYTSFASKHGGVCVGLALDRYVYTMVKRREPFGDGRYRVATATLDVVDETGGISNPAVRGCLSVADPGYGVEVVHWADMPGRCGVGSSSSFVVGLLNALYALRGEYHAPVSLWKRACYVEQEVLGETVGLQDQAWAAFGGLGRLDFPPFCERASSGRWAGPEARIEITPANLSPQARAEFLDHLVVLYTGTQRVASEAAKNYAGGGHEGRVHAIRALAEEGWSALQSRDWEKCGALLDRAWAEKRAIGGVTSTAIDLMYANSRIHGAWGGKLMGAGGGAGCVVLFVPPANRQRCLEGVRREFPRCVPIPVGCSTRGSRVVYSE